VSVKLVVDVRIKDETEAELRAAYVQLVARAAQEPGLIGHQLCQALDAPDRWMVISEWETSEQSDMWDRSEDHRRLLGPMRACFAQATRTALEVREEVR
jgi:heme-degrading monooxygenase HmoA